MMDAEAGDLHGLELSRPRTLSQQSTESSKYNFPLMTSDSGLYTCSSNTSDCSMALESDIESENKVRALKDERLKFALQEARKLRSELERLTKSEHWYKQELRHQKTTRLEDLERIYTQERKFMQENQRLQKECVKLYEKCSNLEKELEKQRLESGENHVQHIYDEDMEKDVGEFEREQQLALIKDQQQLITVLRKQKRSLLEDLSVLTEEKDEKVMDLQRLLADLEFDNKHITQKCKQYAKEKLNLENNVKQTDTKLSTALAEKLNLQKTLVDLKEQLQLQQQLVNLKENEITHIQQHYTDKIQEEQDLDEVHRLSVKYQAEINKKTLEIIELKERLNELQNELEDVQKLQQQNEQQQRQIEQLNFSLETFHKELQQLKTSEVNKNQQLDELQTSLNQLLKDKEILHKSEIAHQNDLFNVRQELKYTIEQYLNIQELYKKTQFQMELLEIEQSKVKFQSQKDHQEIEKLREKLREYLQQTAELSKKIQTLELQLERTNKENLQLQNDSKILQQELKDLKEHELHSRRSLHKSQQSLFEDIEKQDLKATETTKYNTGLIDLEEDKDLQELTLQSNKLQENLNRLNNSSISYKGKPTILEILQNFIKKIEETGEEQEEEANFKENKATSKHPTKEESSEHDQDILDLTKQSYKLFENLDILKEFLNEKEGLQKLVIENEILKKKLTATETEALTLQLKQDINEKTQKCTKLEENCQRQMEKVHNLQEKLLKNDATLYKMQRKLKILQDNNNSEKLEKENKLLKEELLREQTRKTDLNKKLVEERAMVKELRQRLEAVKLKQRPIINMATQCEFLDDTNHSSSKEVEELKSLVCQLQEQQRQFLEKDTHRQAERLQLLNKLMDLQNSKIKNVQQHQQDWEDISTTLNHAQSMEEQMRQELELKRQELEELNHVFGQQNDELRKLEEFTALLDYKRQQEQENLKLTFQQEINVMQQKLRDSQQEIEQQKLANLELEKRQERIHEEEDYPADVAEYEKEIQLLKLKVSKTVEEKETIQKQLNELKESSNDLNEHHKRDAIYMPELVVAKVTHGQENNHVLKPPPTISEDHLRILTKVLEAEYQRKMQRYDEHIHSLLTNVKSLKKSLKSNEEKMIVLSEEHQQTKAELKDLQKTKRQLEEMRLKYEQSQNTIQELKQALALERKQFDLSDIGKTSQNNASFTSSSSYEVANLIDDYKKLIQQSAVATRRPTTSTILELIQRSNQCVPNLQKLETNVVDLRADLQNFLTSFTQKMPVTSMISAASLTVPPSLMDELRLASDGY